MNFKTIVRIANAVTPNWTDEKVSKREQARRPARTIINEGFRVIKLKVMGCFAGKIELIIGASSSGSGKTTFTLGLLRALRNRGIVVQPFKCGPDYIDTQYHTLAAGLESVNLDLFMGSSRHIRQVYRKYGNGAQAGVVEGVMGLFDGYSRMDGSTAHLAAELDVPVLLVVNARSAAYSVAPLVYGFSNFSKNVKIAAVVFNMVGGESHYRILKDACSGMDIPVIGYIPKDKSIEIPSRHLGLALDDVFLVDEFVEKIAAIVEEHIDLDRLVEIFSRREMAGEVCENGSPISDKRRYRVAVAKDSAFNFIYKENADVLEHMGEVIYFSPLDDAAVPQDIDLLYLPGGYPELHLERLSGNKSMIDSIRSYVENGGYALAECGGMMYMCRSIADEAGKEYPMCGLIGREVTMEKKRLKMGYRRFSLGGKEIRGHEFHYSSIKGDEKNDGLVYERAGRISNARGEEVSTPVYRYKNLIAGYTHIYWGEMNPFDLFKM